MKNKILINTIILIIGSFITKLLSMLIKISVSRIIGSNNLSLYMLIVPSFMLLINLSQLGIPLAITKLISEDKYNNKRLLSSTIPIIIISNILIMIIFNLLSPIISIKLLHNKKILLPLISITLVIPFTTISNIARAYFFGKQKIIPHVLSNITEDLVRFLLTILILPKLIYLESKYIITFIILSNIISELISTIILLLFLPKKINIKRKDLIPNKMYIKDTLNIGIPSTITRLIGSITYFLEPIILTNFLKRNYSLTYITHEYGVIQGYIMPLVLLPSFITIQISSILLPTISKKYQEKNTKYIKEKLKQIIKIIIIIGIILNTIIFLNKNLLLKTLYKTNEGIKYINILLPVTIIQYITYPLSSTLDAIGKSKENLKISIISSILRVTLLIILSNLKIGIYSLLITINVNIVIQTTLLIKSTNKFLK